MRSLTVMTFNLRYGTANDGDNAWEGRKGVLIQTLEKYHPVVIGTQEGLDFQLEYITAKLSGYRRFGLSRNGDRSGEHAAILYDSSQVVYRDGGNFWLSETPDLPGSQSWDSSLARMATWAKFQIAGGDGEFYLFNTHFDHRGEIARQKSASLIWQRIEKLSPGLPLFLVGDFNTARGQRVWNFFTGRETLDGKRGDLIDAWEEAPTRTGGVTTTFHGFHGDALEDRRWQGGRWVHETSYIDWILFRPGIRVTSAAIITGNQDGRYPSDHYPVYAEFELPETEPKK